MKFKLSPIRILVFYLSAMMLIGSLSQVGLASIPWLVQMRNFALIFGGGYALYRILLLTKFAKPTRWEHRFITSSILFLLFYLDAPWYLFLGLGLTAELLQRLIRFPTGPSMNPAALTALLASLIGFYPLWWGASFSPRLPLIKDGISIAVFLTIPIAGYVAHTYKKLPAAFAFLVSFGLFYLLIVQQNPLFLLIEGTLIFFAFVMVVEPKTSPVLRNQQLLYGATIGLLSAIANKIYFAEPYSGPLIVSNLLFNLYRNRQFLATKLKGNPKAAQPVVAPGQPAQPTPIQTQPTPPSSPVQTGATINSS